MALSLRGNLYVSGKGCPTATNVHSKNLLPDKSPREEESPTAREALLVVEVLQNQLGEYLLHRPSALNARVLFRCQKEQYLTATGLNQKHSAHEEAQLQHHGASLDKKRQTQLTIRHA
ncbi:virulence protein [Yersinia pestis]|nr:virulence protein [Yersinia pestis]